MNKELSRSTIITKLKRRIIDISYRHKLSHLGSCLTAVEIIYDIYLKKQPDEPFILSCGHAGLALYVVLEHFGFADAEDLLERCGIHPDRLAAPDVIDCSTGSLGQGLPIAVGMALADRSKRVFCLISDGETAEGSIYEALSIANDSEIDNLELHINWNGFSAYRDLPTSYLDWGDAVQAHLTEVEQLPFLKGLDAHYHVMTAEEYEQAMEVLQ